MMVCYPVSVIDILNGTVRDHCERLMVECVSERLGLNHENTTSSYLNACELCLKKNGDLTSFYRESEFCPQAFDYTCLSGTHAGEDTTVRCPGYFLPFDNSSFVSRRCFSNGSWSDARDSYYSCARVPPLLLFFKYLNLSGFALSMTSLCISLVIFYSFRSFASCIRIRIHIHLFFSLVLSNLLSIIWDVFCKYSTSDFLKENPVWCRVCHFSHEYFVTSSAFWMLCEGLYLGIAVIIVFCDETSFMIWFRLLGWGAPFLLIFIYAMVLLFQDDGLDSYWDPDSATLFQYQMIYTIPITLSYVINCVVVLCVLRIIRRRLPMRTWMVKSARAVLILMPLLGPYHIFFMFPPHKDEGTVLQDLYIFSQTVFTSFQGLLVACIFCFTNHDVKLAMLTSMKRSESVAPSAMTSHPG